MSVPEAFSLTISSLRIFKPPKLFQKLVQNIVLFIDCIFGHVLALFVNFVLDHTLWTFPSLHVKRFWNFLCQNENLRFIVKGKYCDTRNKKRNKMFFHPKWWWNVVCVERSGSDWLMTTFPELSLLVVDVMAVIQIRSSSDVSRKISFHCFSSRNRSRRFRPFGEFAKLRRSLPAPSATTDGKSWECCYKENIIKLFAIDLSK